MSGAPDESAGAEAHRPGAVAGRDAGELLGAVVAEAGAGLGFWSADLWAFSDDADALTCRAYWCRDAEAGRSGSCLGAVIRLDQSHDLRRLVLTAEALERHLGDDLSPAEEGALAQAGFSSRVDVPLLAGAEVLGVLSLAAKGEPRRLSEEERERLGAFSRLAAATLRAVCLYEAEESRGERLATMLTAAHGLAASVSPPEIAAAACDEAARLVPGVSCRAEVLLRRDDGTYVAAAEGALDSAAGRRVDALALQAVELDRPEQARTADGDARLVLPLRSGGLPLGCLEITAPLRRQFRAREVELASLLAGQTAAALGRARSFRALQGRSATDALTGLYSRWYFYERLYAEVARARRYHQPLALVLAELDGEEALAGRRGAAFRDAVLAALARMLQASLRDRVDIACRLGGGRFALLLPSTPAGPAHAGLVAARVRERVTGTRLSHDEHGELGSYTMSFGVAGYPDAAEDADELAAAAEALLARALAGGGDRIEPPPGRRRGDA